MFRLVALIAVVAMLSTAPVGAVEMQTNFRYGEQVGFPPMEVPTTVYGGWGTPGWNCNAMGKADVQPSLPAMYPTGCNPSGCNYCDSVWAGYQQKAFHKRVNTRWYYGNHRPSPPGGAMSGDIVDDGTPYQPQSAVESETSSVVRPPQGAPPQTPTPATTKEAESTDDRPAPRTTRSYRLLPRGTNG